MTVLAAFAYTMIAYGPVLAMFSVTVARHPHEVIIMILGAFFWLLSLFFSSVIWISVPPLRDTPAFTLFFSVLLQEGFRSIFYLLLKKADRLLEIVSDDKTRLRKHKLAYVGGLGFAVISSVVAYANVIEAASGPGVVGILDPTEDSKFFVLAGAFGAQAMSMLHVCWGVLLFSGLERRNWFFIVLVPLSHLLVSGLSILNASHSPAYFLTVAYVACIALAALSMITAGAKLKTLKFFFRI